MATKKSTFTGSLNLCSLYFSLTPVRLITTPFSFSISASFLIEAVSLSSSKTSSSFESNTDDGYGDLKIKINLGEITFEKLQKFDDFVKNLDKYTFLDKKKNEQKCTPLICNESLMNFHFNIDKLVVIDKQNKIVESKLSIDELKNLVRGSKIICFIKFDYLYDTSGKYGVKKSVTKIHILE